MEHSRLNTKALGLTGGILWGVSMLTLTLIAYYSGYGADVMKIMTSIYPGYDLSLKGSILGMIYGFIDGFIGCYVFGWLYNKIAK